jgi:hypothetical protein
VSGLTGFEPDHLTPSFKSGVRGCPPGDRSTQVNQRASEHLRTVMNTPEGEPIGVQIGVPVYRTNRATTRTLRSSSRGNVQA